jgi:hypothetical protein
MLDRARLVQLYRELRDLPVLSVYLDVDQHDPAQRRAWKVRLDREASLEGKRITEEGGDEEAFRAALGHIEETLRDQGFIQGRGWVGFATADGVRHHESLAAPMPDLVRFEDGIRVAPYVRGLKRLRKIAVAMADRRHVRFFALEGSQLIESETLYADQEVGDLSDVGVRKAGSRHSGVRGETATDHAQRSLDQGSDRLWKEAVERVVESSGSDGFIVLGGTPEAVGRLETMLPERVRDRTETASAMHMDQSLSDVQELVEGAASVLNKRLQGELVAGVVDQARAGGKGVLGRDETVVALRQMRVDTLLLSRNFLRDDPELADRAVGTALAQDAEVEEISGPGADVLDHEAGGMGARLRYRVEEPAGAAGD